MSSFLDACGANGPLYWSIERRGVAGVEQLVFDVPFLVVGCDPSSDLQLRHPEVSGRHAYLQLVGGRLFCVDLGSATGTYVDGRCWRSGWVGHGESIRIGPYRLRLAGRGQDLDDAAQQPALDLELAHRSVRTSSCPFAAGMTLLGSAEGCQARLVDPGVADYHCSLLQTSRGIWAVDLLGHGGISINGTRARLGRVYEGDELRLGRSRVRVHAAGASSSTVASTAADGLVAAQGLPADPANRGDADDVSALLADLPPEKAELVRSFLVPMANQLSLMQQQMFDRLQQAERERFRALAEFQREQFGSIHEELDQLNELRQEIDELRAELRAQGRAPQARDRSSAGAATSRPRLGSAAPELGPAALEPPAVPKVLRMTVGEAS